MAELILSAFPRNHTGNFLAKSQIKTAATIAKLIHLKISLARSVTEPRLSSAAWALRATQKKRTTKLERTHNRPFCPIRFCFIEICLIGPLLPDHRDEAAFRECAEQFRRKAVGR